MESTFQGTITEAIEILERMKTASALESYDLLEEARAGLDKAESILDHHVEVWESIYQQAKL